MTSVLLIAYMAVTFVMTNNSASAATAPASSPVIIDIRGGDNNRFVTPSEVSRLIAPMLPPAGEPIVTSRVNTLAMEQMLSGVDNIEWARCSHTALGRIKIEIIPMQPVARVFDTDSSYYINRSGKRLHASLRYRSDVPVIQGHLNDAAQAVSLMPLIDSINANRELSRIVTALRVEPNGDVIIIPSIRGHIINFGNPATDITNKFTRLKVMYSEVMPVKGWDFYDTISVKYSGRVIATRRDPKKPLPAYIADPEGDAAEARAIEATLPSRDDNLSKQQDTAEPAAQPAPAPVQSPAPQPTPEPSATPVPEPSATPVPEPSAAPAAEPLPDLPEEPEIPTIMID